VIKHLILCVFSLYLPKIKGLQGFRIFEAVNQTEKHGTEGARFLLVLMVKELMHMM